MAETRGAATIVDRVEGWGHKASSDSNREDNDTWGSDTGNSITATDASKESTANRVARALKVRKSFVEEVDPAIVDRTVGYGGEFTGIGGADEQYGYDHSLDDETPVELADSDDYKNGVFNDADDEEEDGEGDNTAHSTSDSEALATGRTADSRATVDLNVDTTEFEELDEDEQAFHTAQVRRTSIVDRTDGWGHDDGGFANRKDS